MRQFFGIPLAGHEVGGSAGGMRAMAGQIRTRWYDFNVWVSNRDGAEYHGGKEWEVGVYTTDYDPIAFIVPGAPVKVVDAYEYQKLQACITCNVLAERYPTHNFEPLPSDEVGGVREGAGWAVTFSTGGMCITCPYTGLDCRFPAYEGAYGIAAIDKQSMALINDPFGLILHNPR